MGMRGGRERSKPTKQGFVVLTAKDVDTKEGVKTFWKGSIPLEDGTSISIQLKTDTNGKIDIREGRGKKEGKEVCILSTAEFVNSNYKRR